jgi:hypothetical protein
MEAILAFNKKHAALCLPALYSVPVVSGKGITFCSGYPLWLWSMIGIYVFSPIMATTQ